MKFDIDEIGPVRRKVRVELPAERVATEFSRVYRNLGQRVRVKGFRAGKIPRTVLQGIYGDEVKGQVRSQLVEDSLGEVIRERGLQIVSRPEVEVDELDESRAFSFSAVFEVKPEIQVQNYLGLEIEKVKLSITDAQVSEALGRLQEAHARLEPVDGRAIVQSGDFVVLDYQGSVDGQPFPAGKGEDYLLEVGSGRALPEFENGLIGLTRGEPHSLKVTYPPDYPNKDIAGKSAEFSIVVREIKQKVLPPLDDDFAKDHGECASLGELKARIRTRLEEELKRYQTEDLKEKVLSRLLETHSFDAPASMIERQTRYLMERYRAETGSAGAGAPPAEEARKALEARATRQVRATLLLEKISQLERIEVTDAEVQARVDQLARAAGDRVKAVREFYAEPEHRDELRAQLVFDRTLQFLVERANAKEVEPTVSTVDEQVEKR